MSFSEWIQNTRLATIIAILMATLAWAVAAWVEIPITYTLTGESKRAGTDTAPAQTGVVIKVPGEL